LLPSVPLPPKEREREKTSSERLRKSGPNYYTKRRGLHCRLPRLLLLSGRLLLRGQDLFINAPALLSLPLGNTDGLFSHDHEVSPSLRLFSLSSLLRIIICLSKLLLLLKKLLLLFFSWIVADLLLFYPKKNNKEEEEEEEENNFFVFSCFLFLYYCCGFASISFHKKTNNNKQEEDRDEENLQIHFGRGCC
jgi:hypothetical protein